MLEKLKIKDYMFSDVAYENIVGSQHDFSNKKNQPKSGFLSVKTSVVYML